MFLVVVSALLFADTSPDPKPATPRGPAPMLVTVQIKDGKLVSNREVIVTVPVLVKQKVIVNGQAEERTVTQYQTMKRLETIQWDLKKATMSEAGGKKVDLKTAKKLLAKPRPVVVSADGKAVDAGWLKLFAKDTLVIVPELPSGPGKIPLPAAKIPLPDKAKDSTPSTAPVPVKKP